MPLVVSKQGDDSSRTRVGAKARNRKKHRAKQPNTFLHRSGHMPRDPSMKLSPKHGSQVHKHNQPSAPHHMGDWRNEQHDVCSLFSLQTVGWRGWPVLRELGAAIRLGFMLWCGAVADHINVSNNWVMMPGAALHSSPGCQHAPDAIAPLSCVLLPWKQHKQDPSSFNTQCHQMACVLRRGGAHPIWVSCHVSERSFHTTADAASNHPATGMERWRPHGKEDPCCERGGRLMLPTTTRREHRRRWAPQSPAETSRRSGKRWSAGPLSREIVPRASGGR